MNTPTERLSSNEPEVVRTVIREMAAALRNGDGDALDMATAIHPLATHPCSTVRRAVAEAAEFFADPFADWALDRLRDDADPFVRHSAERSTRLRAKRLAKKARVDRENELVEDILAEIESKHSRAARRLAERAVARGREHHVGQLFHELAKAMVAVETACEDVNAGLEKTPLDRALLKDRMVALRGRQSFFWSIVEMARRSTETVRPSFAEHNVAALIEDAHAQLLERLGPRAARVSFINDIDRTLTLVADRNALLQAFQNVLNNGAEAHPETAETISLRASTKLLRGGARIAVVLSDTGAGMTKARLERLFVPFATGKPKGVGLGLVIVKRMIEEVHGGRVEVESEVGRGTTVTMTLPLAQAARRGGRS